MRGQKMNLNRMNEMQKMNTQGMMGAMSSIQKIGKGKRKYDVKIDKNNKKFLSKLIVEMKKQMAGYGANPQTKGVIDFLNYLETESKNKNKSIKMSFEELEFLKKTVAESVKGMEIMEFKWYQLFRKVMVKIMLKQYRYLLEDLNK